MMTPSESSLQLSVVVPVYNGIKFMAGCLASIAQAVQALPVQERRAVEVIVCDNHSTDGTQEIALQTPLECAYRVVSPPEHYSNRTLNWHYGLSQAQGTWMMMLHADDLMASGGLCAILDACRQQADSKTVMITGRHRTFTEENPPSRLKPAWPLAAMLNGEAMRQRVLPFHCPLVPFTVMRRATYLEVGGLDARYELVQDWDLWIRLLGLGNLYYMPQEFGRWRLHGFSTHYATIFAQNHLELTSTLPRLVPNLPTQVVDAAIDAQLAKVVAWLPEVSLSTLLSGIKGAERVLSRPYPSTEQAEQARRHYNRYVSKELYKLRFAGSFRRK